MNNRLREKQKQEATKRLEILQSKYMLHNNVLKQFRSNEIIYYSENFGELQQGILYWLHNKNEFINIVKKIEEENNIYVYHCIFNHYKDYGDALAMLYVSPEDELWEEERQELKDGYPYTYTYNFSSPEFSEFGEISIIGVNGGIGRLY